MKQIDLHVHTNCSDGTDSPTELIDKAIGKGLSAIAITDHDTIDGIAEALEAARGKEIEVIPGIEFSTFFDRKEIHIVGLFIDHTDPDFNLRLQEFKDGREAKNIKMCNKFKNIGIEVSYDEMKSMYPGSVITRAHFADYLLAKGITRHRAEAFERYIGDGGPCYVDRVKITPAEAIDLIHSVGGVAVLAHPVLYHLGESMMNRLMDYLLEHGIDALEAIYSTYSYSEESQMKTLARSCGIAISGGSDYHGTNKPGLDLGTGYSTLFVPYDILTELKKCQ